MKNKPGMAQEGKYIYGIIKHPGSIDFGFIGMGKPPEKVYGINFRDICAVVSNSPVIQYDPRRANLITHEKVLEEIMRGYTVLPARFSTISENNSNHSIINILEKDYNKLKELLDKMEGKKELGVKVLIKENEIFKEILEKYDDIRKMKKKIASLPPDKTHYQRIKIGEMVAGMLKHESEQYKNEIFRTLNPLAEEVKVNDNFGEMMILNAAFLINEDIESQFDEAVNQLDKNIGRFVTFKYVGSLPPYNFVNLAINTGKI